MKSDNKGRGGRQEFSQMFQDAAQRNFDLVLFWALDRFTREGLQKTIFYLRQLDDCGVKFHSYTEPYLNTDQELVRDILLSVLASLAKQERRRINGGTKGWARDSQEKRQPWVLQRKSTCETKLQT